MSQALGKLREYETLVVLNPELTDDVVSQTMARLGEVLEKMKAVILREDRWGKRKLSFEVKKQPRANFINLHYVGEVGVVEELERTLRNMEEAMRFLTTVNGEVEDIEAKKSEVEKMERERAADRAKAEAERKEREARLAAEAVGQATQISDEADRSEHAS